MNGKLTAEACLRPIKIIDSTEKRQNTCQPGSKRLFARNPPVVVPTSPRPRQTACRSADEW